MFYTYILINKDRNKTYAGHTNNLERRLQEHNSGLVASTKHYKPYQFLYSESHDSLDKAKKREKYFKNYRGRQKIKQFVEFCD